LGIALCPERVVAADLKAGRLKRLDWAQAPTETMVLMITHVEKWRSPLLEDFMIMAREGICLE